MGAALAAGLSVTFAAVGLATGLAAEGFAAVFGTDLPAGAVAGLVALLAFDTGFIASLTDLTTGLALTLEAGFAAEWLTPLPPDAGLVAGGALRPVDFAPDTLAPLAEGLGG